MKRNTYMQDEVLVDKFNSKQLLRVIKYMLPYKGVFIGVLALMIFAVFLGLVSPVLNSYIVNTVIPNKNIEMMYYVLTGLIFINLLDIVIQYLQGKYMARLGHKVIYQIRRDVFIKMQQLSFDFFDNRPAGKILVRVTSYVDELANFFANVMINFVMTIFRMLMVIVFMFALNYVLALVVLASVVPLMVFIFIIRRSLKTRFRNNRTKHSNRTAYIHENIMGNIVTKEFNRTDKNCEIYSDIIDECKRAWMKAINVNELFVPGTEMFWNYGNLALYGVAFLLIATPSAIGMTLGTVIAFSNYMGMFNGPINQLAVILQQMAQVSSNLERIFEMLDMDPLITDKPYAVELPPISGHVEFNNVTFSYDGKTNILENFNLDVPEGKTIALVGPTGAGKTTVINMISRFYDVSAGSVKIDGFDVRDVTLTSLRSQMGVMMQDTYIFKGTIMDNIRYGRPTANDSECVEAAKKVYADEFISRLPNGYQTEVNERGDGLSTGERQLLSFARVMLVDPKILILDEATSSIDTETEEKIQKAMDVLLVGRTNFMIAHRLSTIRKADCILYIADKGIQEAGTHDVLMKRGGLYYQLNVK